MLATLGWACGASERNSIHVPNSRGPEGSRQHGAASDDRRLRLRGDRDRAKRHIQRTPHSLKRKKARDDFDEVDG